MLEEGFPQIAPLILLLARMLSEISVSNEVASSLISKTLEDAHFNNVIELNCA